MFYVVYCITPRRFTLFQNKRKWPLWWFVTAQWVPSMPEIPTDRRCVFRATMPLATYDKIWHQFVVHRSGKTCRYTPWSHLWQLNSQQQQQSITDPGSSANNPFQLAEPTGASDSTHFGTNTTSPVVAATREAFREFFDNRRGRFRCGRWAPNKKH